MPTASEADIDMDSSFGVRKVVACRIANNGSLYYKVKWEATWEPAESLASCQHLIDAFWSFVDRVDTEKELGAELRAKCCQYDSSSHLIGNGLPFVSGLSDTEKLEIDKLIDRTSKTLSSVQSPSYKLGSSHLLSLQQEPAKQLVKISSKEKTKSQDLKTDVDICKATDKAADTMPSPTKFSLAHGLQYIESFSNPYVKIILVCKFCNKEQSLKFSQQWKQHYLDAHAPDEEKPHKCSFCGAAFARSDSLKRHIKKHDDSKMEPFKSDIFELDQL